MQLAKDERLVREASRTSIVSGVVSRTPEELANIVLLFASSDGWMDKVRLHAERRWYERLYHGPNYDTWVISWLPGQSTGFHDHGASSGAFVVATGIQPFATPDSFDSILTNLPARSLQLRRHAPRAITPTLAGQ